MKALKAVGRDAAVLDWVGHRFSLANWGGGGGEGGRRNAPAQ